MRKLFFLLLGSSVISSIAPLHADQKIPLITGDLSVQDKASRLETEVVSIGRLAASPVALHRHAGKFILIVQNASGDPKASFVLESLSGAQQTATPILHFD